MTKAKDIRVIIGIIGNVISSLISLSRMPKLIQIYKKKSVEGFEPHRHLVLMMKCSFWVLYGLPVIRKDSLLVTTSNGVGFVIQLIYVLVFYYYCEESDKRDLYVCLVIEFMFLISIDAIAIWGIQGLSLQQNITGVFCNVFNIVMSLSFARNTMLETKSFKFMPFWLSFVSFINAGIWTAYSLIYKIDIYILIISVFETLLCASQLIANVYYGSLARTVHPLEIE